MTDDEKAERQMTVIIAVVIAGIVMFTVASIAMIVIELVNP